MKTSSEKNTNAKQTASETKTKTATVMEPGHIFAVKVYICNYGIIAVKTLISLAFFQP